MAQKLPKIAQKLPKLAQKWPKMAQKWPKIAQKLAPAEKKIAQIYLQHLQLFASLIDYPKNMKDRQCSYTQSFIFRCNAFRPQVGLGQRLRQILQRSTWPVLQHRWGRGWPAIPRRLKTSATFVTKCVKLILCQLEQSSPRSFNLIRLE